MALTHLDKLVSPKSIALIGASKRPGSVGHVLAQNLISAGFDGPILPVNPKHDSIGGILTFRDIEALPFAPDLAVVSTPPDTVPQVIDQLAQKGTHAAVVITAGFHAGGDPAEDARHHALLKAARGRVRILGPNVLGMLVPGVGLNASFAHIAPKKGNIAFLAQSGAMLTSVLDWATPRGIGFSHMISMGDMLDVDFADMLDFLAIDPNVKAILLYIEAIKNARRFLSAARAAARLKPVVAIKVGQHAEAAAAASSHTGALAGSDAVYDVAFRRAGVLRVGSMGELFDAVETLSTSTKVRGNRAAIVTNGGGVGVICTDALLDMGGKLADLSDATMQKLDEVLPATWSKGNPVDIIGDAPGSRYASAMAAVLADPAVDATIVLNCPTAIADGPEAAGAVIEQAKKARKPVFTAWLGEQAAAPARKMYLDAGIPTYSTPGRAARGFMHIARYKAAQEQLMEVPPAQPDAHRDTAQVQAILKEALDEGREWLTEPEAKHVLAAYGIPVAETEIAATPAEAKARALAMPGPYAVKILSPDITHKSDVGGVDLDLETPDIVQRATEEMLARVADRRPDARIEGVTVQRMVKRGGAHELIVGVHEDSQFGPVLLFGQGGKAVELIGDTAMALPPLNMLLTRDLMARTKIHKLLVGYRDELPADLDAIAGAIMNVSQLVVDCADIAELDINPLLADPNGVVALDARVRVRRAGQAGHARLAIRPYPNDLEGTIETRDGLKVPIRPIRPEDAPVLQEMVARSKPEDLRLRFMSMIKELPDQMAAVLTQIDYDRAMAFAALDPNDPSKFWGVVRLSADADTTRAEYAVLVRSDLIGSGLGYALMERIIGHAKAIGIEVLYGEILRDNSRMLKMCETFGFTRHRTEDDEIVEMQLDCTK